MAAVAVAAVVVDSAALAAVLTAEDAAVAQLDPFRLPCATEPVLARLLAVVRTHKATDM